MPCTDANCLYMTSAIETAGTDNPEEYGCYSNKKDCELGKKDCQC